MNQDKTKDKRKGQDKEASQQVRRKKAQRGMQELRSNASEEVIIEGRKQAQRGMQESRSNASEEVKMEAREKDRRRKSTRRSNVSEEVKMEAREKDRRRKSTRRSNASQEVKMETRREAQLRMQELRSNAPEEVKMEAREKDRERKSKRRREASEEVKMETRERDRRREAKTKRSEASEEVINKPVVIDFGTLKSFIITNLNASLNNFEQDVENAVMMNYVNAGYEEFSHDTTIEEQVKKQEVNADDVNRIMEEMLERMGRTHNAKDVNDVNNDCDLLTCGLCGIREFQRNSSGGKCFHWILLDRYPCIAYTSDELENLRMKKNKWSQVSLPVSDDGTEKCFDLWKLMSCFELDKDTVYHVHPEFVQWKKNKKNESLLGTFACKTCCSYIKHDKRPPFSIAKGIDFGDTSRIGLSRPNFLEEMVLAQVRVCSRVVKIASKPETNDHHLMKNRKYTLKSHCIAFQHDAPYVAGKEFSIQDVMNANMTFHFVQSKNKMDHLIDHVFNKCSITHVRPFVIRQYLTMFRYINPLYKDIEIPSMENLREQCKDAITTLRAKCHQNVDPEIVRFEESAFEHVSDVHPDNVAVDDNANSRTAASEDVQLDENMAYSFVQRDATAERDESDDSPHDDYADDDNEEHVTERKFLQRLRRFFQHEKTIVHESTRVDTPVNEFKSNHELLRKAFPFVFLFGNIYRPIHGSLSLHQRRHLLLQYTTTPATCRELIFLLISQYLRHQNITSVYLGMKNAKKEDVNEFYKIIQAKDFEQRLDAAIKNPKMDSAKDIVNIASKVINLTGGHPTFGAVERKIAMSNIYAMARKYGPGSSFFTISFDPTNNPNVFRMMQKSVDNEHFPATTSSSFFQNLRTCSKYTDDNTKQAYDCSFVERANMIISNPVATAYEYNHLVESFCEVMLGIHPSICQSTGQKQRKSTCIIGQKKGILGKIIGLYGTNDRTAAGAMHLHMILYGSIPPHILQRAAERTNLQVVIKNSLNSMYRCEISRPIHIVSLIRKWFLQCTNASMFHESNTAQVQVPTFPSTTIFVPATICIPPPSNSSADANQRFSEYMSFNAARTQIHEHTFTCHYHKSGKTGCRGNYPQGEVSKTGIVELLPVYNDAGSTVTGFKTVSKDLISVSKDNDDDEVQEDARSDEDEEYDDHTKEQAQHDSIMKEQDLLPSSKDDDKQAMIQTLESMLKLYKVINDEDKIILWDLQRQKLQPLHPLPEPLSDEGDTTVVDPSKSIQIQQTILNCFKSELSSLEAASSMNEFLQSIPKTLLLSLYNFVNKHLPEANLSTVCFNPVFTAVNGGNSANYLLGNTTQSKNSLMYVGPYIGKNNVQLMESLSILNHAKQRYNEKKQDEDKEDRSSRNPSKDEDEETNAAVKFMITHILNRLDIQFEISDMQASSVLLGGTTEICSDDFGWYNTNDHTKYVEQSQEFDKTINDDVAALNEEEKKARRRIAACDGLRGTLYQFKTKDEDEDEDEDEMEDEHGHLMKTIITVPYALHYTYRGTALKHLNRYEWSSVIKVIEKKTVENKDHGFTTPDGTSKEKKRGRKSNMRFPFAPGHPLEKSHEQILRSKHITPRIGGSIPKCPSFPSAINNDEDVNQVCPEWEKDMNAYAKFFLTALRPESSVCNGEENAYDYTWKALYDWLKYLIKDDKKISAFRLQLFVHLNLELTTREPNNTVMQMYRQRKRTIWTEQDQNEYNCHTGNFHNDDNDADEEHALDEIEMLCNTMAINQEKELARVLNRLRKNAANADAQVKQFLSMFPLSSSLSAEDQEGNLSTQPRSYNSSFIFDLDKRRERREEITDNINHKTMTRLNNVFRKIKDASPSLDAKQQATTTPCSVGNMSDRTSNDDECILFKASLEKRLDYHIRTMDLSNDKKNLMKHIGNYIVRHMMEKHDSSETRRTTAAPIYFVSGAPGVGKSYLVNCLSKLVQQIDPGSIGTFRLSYTGIAAANIEGATLFVLNIKVTLKEGRYPIPLEPDEIITLKTQYGLGKDHLYFLVLDEMPTIKTTFLAAIEHRFKQLREDDRPFGNVPVLFTGDFHQHTSIGKQSDNIAGSIQEMITYEKKGHDTMMENKRFGIDCPLKNICEIFLRSNWIELTEQKRSEDAMHTAIITKLYNNGQLTMDDLKQYKFLSKEDMQDSDWQMAPIICHTNDERRRFEFIQLQRFALLHDVPIIRWKAKNKIMTRNNDQELDPNDPLQYQYFIANAPAVILNNINTEVKICNGSKARLHSLSFETANEMENFKEQLQTAATSHTKKHEPSIITLDRAPYSVNVELFADEPTDTETMKTAKEEERRKWQYGTLLEGNVVIPLIGSFINQPSSVKLTIKVTNCNEYAQVNHRPIAPYCLSFALTSFKGQSQTLHKIIILLKANPSKAYIQHFSLNEFFVNISRVRSSDDIRFLTDESHPTYFSINYLTKLKFSNNILNLINSFKPIEEGSIVRRFDRDIYENLLFGN